MERYVFLFFVFYVLYTHGNKLGSTFTSWEMFEKLHFPIYSPALEKWGYTGFTLSCLLAGLPEGPR